MYWLSVVQVRVEPMIQWYQPKNKNENKFLTVSLNLSAPPSTISAPCDELGLSVKEWLSGAINTLSYFCLMREILLIQ